jgi:hypothetical protein
MSSDQDGKKPASTDAKAPAEQDTAQEQEGGLEAIKPHLAGMIGMHIDQPGIAPCFVELCEAVVAVNDVKRPSQFEQERDCWSPFRSERQARAAMPEVACKL